ncbi:radical SAM protein, partial [bacterium]|nr:radical SAM protein [bacterium]
SRPLDGFGDLSAPGVSGGSCRSAQDDVDALRKDNCLSHPIDHLFVLPVLDRYLLYHPLNGQYALLNQSGVSLIRDAMQGTSAAEVPEEFSELIEILSLSGVIHPEKTGAVNPEFLGIILSRACNMACAYCDFGAHQNNKDKLEAGQMTAAIDWFAGHQKQNGRKLLPIQFFGGEPFVERELMDIAVHHARFIASRNGLVPRFEALTNGYYGATRRRFIADYFDRVIISLDGFRNDHDRTRPAAAAKSSYDTVVETAKYLSGHDLQLSIRCCVTSESVQRMEDMADWFCREFNPDKVNFETLTENSLTQKAGLRPPDPYLFAEHCLKSWRVLRNHGVDPAYAPVALNRPQTTSCPAGRDVLIVHPDGMVASCYVQKKDWIERGMDLSVGNIKCGQLQLDEKKLLSFRDRLHEKVRCEHCFCRYGCAGGCHVNNTYPGCASNYTDFCIHTRILTLCRLLEEMGESTLADQLLGDKASLERLVKQLSDHILDFEV